VPLADATGRSASNPAPSAAAPAPTRKERRLVTCVRLGTGSPTSCVRGSERRDEFWDDVVDKEASLLMLYSDLLL
jgi:hypothetical protein